MNGISSELHDKPVNFERSNVLDIYRDNEKQDNPIHYIIEPCMTEVAFLKINACRETTLLGLSLPPFFQENQGMKLS